ncbi:helix-turn-helix domain-containing protein [Streptomyces rapamycinicus]|uniref:Membrane protein n=2 Tax=Streptomyces rapamycinicus TaxID=1226757 RepID=A0A0A0NRG5_STRRN|nr:XRE family transcriptional regulator [Streptomyces rapamycinicus]AGP57150.1 membrane protein [Streptomyces rapamycinicus NRRL 5491]MBB4784791.1 transcriptional regulator with XRE-family HTH domain [Streptomyces rapamycinicus]RLV79731.1 membrane protein [Streptomyces rapamycinicus NRRL 5491]UTO65047.1 XRE family transcriptional regulator [Streptomyces rapamycinicus]UTP33003.1 XRE family transcriptional regulator [Streptomyces rapamycinicus NRRL 5491]
MPRWRDLPEELDPQVREFTGRLRTLVERSGLSVVAVADRTGCSKSSWERYLNGRLLPPRGAVEALAETTGADVHHLSALWELAERAWSRSQMRRDVTMEAISVARARTAVEQFDPAAQGVDARKNGRSPGEARPRVEPPDPEQPLVATAPVFPARAASAGRAPDSAEPPSPASSLPPSSPPSSSPPPSSSASPRGRKRVAALSAGGLVGALLLVAGAVVLLDAGDDGGKRGQKPATAPATSARQQLPEGVKCAGQDCTGQDPQAMGCGTSATTTADVTVGTAYVEVRYSKTCEAAWARITRATPGDVIQVKAPGADGGAARSQSGRVGADGDAYTKMIPVDSPARATACATLGGGTRACTAPGARG